MSRRNSPGIPGGAVIIGILALLPAACGGGGGGSNDATATKTATSAATKPATAQATPVPATARSTVSTATSEAQRPPTVSGLPTVPPAATNTPPPAQQTRVDVVMIEFALTPSIGVAPAGNVTFNLENRGTIAHDFYVVRTGLAPNALPYDSAAYQVRTSELDVISHQASVAPGTGAEVAVELSGGHYVLICNIVGHYQAGMTTAFTVQ